MDLSEVRQILVSSSQSPEVMLVGFGYLPPSWIKASLSCTLWVPYALAYGLNYHTKLFCNAAVIRAPPNWPLLCWKISGWLGARQSCEAKLTHHSNRMGLCPSTWHMNVIIMYTCHSDKMVSPDPSLNCSRIPVLHRSCFNYLLCGFLSYSKSTSLCWIAAT